MKRLAYRLFYSAVEDYEGVVSVCSFGGRSAAEERRFALTMYRHVYYTGRDRDIAFREAQNVRNRKAAEIA